MSLIKNNTKWILFLSSSAQPEERHVLDLAFGLQILESIGIVQTDISIYIDGLDRHTISQLIASGSKNTHTIKESKDFFIDQTKNSHENLVMFVTGHGGIEGIDAPTPIKPYALLQQIKGAPKLKHAVLYLGQCHAGIFNYIGAGRKAPDSNEPEIIIVGATNLHNSISSPTQELLVSGNITWVANLFLLHIFKWLSKPVDVDGDGKTTVIDSYKYAGVMSNVANKNVKISSFVRSLNLHPTFIAAQSANQAAPSIQTQLTLDALALQYETELAIQYNHQECWILNAIPAQMIEF